MKSNKLSCLLFLLFCLVHWNSVDALCSLSNQIIAECQDFEDARYIETYQVQILRAPSFSKTLLPGHFRNFTTLRYLDLSGGKIEEIESGSFAKLASLQSLDLSQNHISNLEAGAFDGLKQLHSLRLNDNKITQLPVALMNLKGLRLLDLSNNPLVCDCASLKLRDALWARGVKLSRKTTCTELYAGPDLYIYKPDTNKVCNYEKQEELEMQGDQPADSNVDGSGEAEEDNIKDKENNSNGEKESSQPLSVEDEEDEPPSNEETILTSGSSTEAPLLSSVSTSDEVVSTTTVTTSSSTPKEDDATVGTTSEVAIAKSQNLDGANVLKESEESEETGDSKEVNNSKEFRQSENKEADPIAAPTVTESTIKYSTSTESERINIIVPDEGSGDGEDDGSGSDSSGLIDHMPGIDFNQTSEITDDEEAQNSTTSTTTAESLSWWSFGGSLINNFNPWGTTVAPETSSTTTSTEDDLKEEQFIKVTQSPPLESVPTDDEVTVQPRVIMQDEAAKQSSRTFILSDENKDNTLDLALDSKESKQGMGSYIVLAALLAILAALIMIAAYRGDFCRKRQKRRDVERGTEMKDMQKSLLDQNQTTQPKIQVSNGTTLENVPLMNSSTLPEEPKDNQKSYDITPVVTNGSSKPNGTTTEASDPVKPPRKVMSYEIEAPLNGLNPPMDDIDGPTSPCLHNGSNENLDSDSYDGKPPLSPEAQRVKITMQDNPDSVPKTPILITRLKGGENLVKAP